MRNLTDLLLVHFPFPIVSVAFPTQNMGNAVSEMQGKRSYRETATFQEHLHCILQTK